MGLLIAVFIGQRGEAMKIYGPKDGIARAFNARLGPGWDVAPGGSAGDNCARIWNENLLQKIRDAVKALPSHCEAWAMYGYTDIGDRGSDQKTQMQRQGWEQTLLRWLATKVYSSPRYSDVRALEAMDGYAVLLMVLRDTRATQYGGKNIYSMADLAAAIGVDRSQFTRSRHWGGFVEVALDATDEITRETLAPVSVVVDEINCLGSNAA